MGLPFKLSLPLTIATGLLTAFGCGSNSFKGGGNNGQKAAAPAPLSGAASFVNLPCATSGIPSIQTVEGPADKMIQAQGEFCPNSLAQLSVLFVVDFSGSMRKNDPSNGASCGRLRSAQAIVSRISAKIRPQDTVRSGIVVFSSGSQITAPMQPIQGFQSLLTVDNFCGSAGATNYGASFQTAQQALAGITGPKAIYFITDGEPSFSQDQTQDQAAGLSAAQALRAAMPDVGINAVFLNSQGSASAGFDPKSYLAQITGSIDKVGVVTNADNLAEEILKFALPVANIMEQSARILLRAVSIGQQAEVKIAKFERSPSNPNAYAYTTEPFRPFGAPGAEVLNELIVSAQDMSGASQQGIGNLTYRQK